MGKYDFRSDLPLGNEGEDVVIKQLQKMGAKLISKNNDNRYDFIMEKDNNQVKYEIKTDDYCKPTYDTGNMFIEFECRGKKSGIMVSEAKWFVTYYKHLNEIWYIQTQKLLNLINENNIRKHENSGDVGSNTKGWLFPRNNFKNHFIIRTVYK